MRICYVQNDEFLAERNEKWVMPAPRPYAEIQTSLKLGHTVSIVCWLKEATKNPTSEKWEGINIHRVITEVNTDSTLKKVKIFRKAQKELAAKITSLKPDAIVCHNLEPLSGCVKAKRKLKIPLLYDSHEDWPAMVGEKSPREGKLFAAMENRLIKHVDHTYTVSPGIVEKYRRMNAPVSLIYNTRYAKGAPLRSGSLANQMRLEIGFGPDDFVLGFVGNLTKESMLEFLMDLLKELPGRVKLLLVGGREDAVSKYQKYAQKAGLEDRVHITGRVPPSRLLNFVSCIDLGSAILEPASDNYKFRAPHKLFEYMACAIPIIASDFPDMRTIVVDDAKCGVAVEPSDRVAIKREILDFIENPDKVDRLGRQGREAFEREYSWERMEERLAESHPVFQRA